jgi:hypothetical protein
MQLDNLESGKIDKSKLPDYYLTDDKKGIRFWRLFIDLFQNTMKHIWEWHETAEQRFDIAQDKILEQEQRLNQIEGDLCKQGYKKYC